MDFQPWDSSLPMVEEDIELNLESKCLLEKEKGIQVQLNGLVETVFWIIWNLHSILKQLKL